MTIKNLGGGFFRLTYDYGDHGEKAKTPANTSSVLFMFRDDEVSIVRGSLMVSIPEIRAAMVTR